MDVVDDVETLTDRLIQTPRAQLLRALRAPEFGDAHVVRRLLTLADHFSRRDRELAIGVIWKAVSLVERLRPAPDINDLRFETWKLASAILCEAGLVKETESALERAEDAARFTADPVRSEALVRFYRALFWSEPDVWLPHEATLLLDQVEPIFQAWDEPRRLALRRARASLLFRSGAFEEALRLFEQVLTSTAEEASFEYLDNLHNVVGMRVELGESTDDLEQLLYTLISENESRGRTVIAATERWMLGRVQSLRGDHETAERMFVAAMEAVGNSDTRVRIGLDRVRALLLAGRHTEASRLCQALAAEAVELDRREPSRRRALTAEVLAYARDAASRGAITADLILDLSRYVARIDRQRPTTFVPPMPLADM